MQLDQRLNKLATGISVTDAIDAYLRDQSPADEAVDVEEARRQELLAIVEIMVVMAAVDGEVQPEEIAQLRASIDNLSDLSAVPRLDLDETLSELTDEPATDGWKERLEAAAARVRTPDGRDFAFRLAAGVAFVDDFVAPAEAAAIDTLAQALELSSDQTRAILHEVRETLFG